MEELEKELAGDVTKQLEALASQVAAKLGQTETDVMTRFQKELELIKKQLPTLSTEVQQSRAFIRVKGLYKQELRSPAKMFEGIILGAASPFDMIGQMMREARARFTKDPEEAVTKGIVSAEGQPLDTRTHRGVRENPNVGKPLPEHEWIQNLYGIARCPSEPDHTTPKVFTMALGDRLATKVKIPVFKTVVFRANIPDRQPDPKVLKLNPYARIEFTPAEIEDFPPLQAMLEESPLLDAHRVNLDGIAGFHEREQNNPQRFCIVKGDASGILPDPNPVTGNRMIILDDESLPADHDGVVGWVPEELFGMLDFGVGSRIFVTGSTVKYQPDQSRPPTTMLNVHGVYAVPEYKIPPDEVPQSVISRDAEQVK